MRASLLASMCLAALACGCAAPAPDTASATPEAAQPMAAAAMPSMLALSGDGIHYVEGAEPTRPRVRYLDGQVSLNQSCAIQLGNKLNRKIPPVYVNGSPVGFC